LVVLGFIANRDTSVDEVNRRKAAAEKSSVLGTTRKNGKASTLNHDAFEYFDANHTA